MFRGVNSIFTVVSLIVILFIASWAIGLTSAQPLPVKESAEPVTISEDDASAVRIEEPTFSDPDSELEVTDRKAVPIPEDEAAEAERLREYLHWKHNAAPIETDETAASEQLLDYLRWKHNAAPIEANKTAASEQLLDYLRWKHHLDDRPE